jgi:hypothetical protein
MQDQSKPPADAVPLAEVNPYIAKTLRWRRRQRTSTAFVVPPEPVFIIERPIMDDEGRYYTPAWASNDLVGGARALERQLIRGDLFAWGQASHPWGQWRAIEPHTWSILSIEDLEQGIVRVAAPSEARLYNVVVRKAPASTIEPKLPAAHQSTVGDETRCRKWLLEEMAAGDPKRPKAHYEGEAKRRFSVGPRAFKRAWDDAVAESGNARWSKPGAKNGAPPAATAAADNSSI